MADERLRELERAWRGSNDPSDAERLLAEHARAGTTLLALARRVVELERSFDLVVARGCGYDALRALAIRELRARAVTWEELVGLHAPPARPLGEPCPLCGGTFMWLPDVGVFECMTCPEARLGPPQGLDLILRSPVARFEDLLAARDPFDGELRRVQEPLRILLLHWEGRWYPVQSWQEEQTLERAIEVPDRPAATTAVAVILDEPAARALAEQAAEERRRAALGALAAALLRLTSRAAARVGAALAAASGGRLAGALQAVVRAPAERLAVGLDLVARRPLAALASALAALAARRSRLVPPAPGPAVVDRDRLDLPAPVRFAAIARRVVVVALPGGRLRVLAGAPRLEASPRVPVLVIALPSGLGADQVAAARGGAQGAARQAEVAVELASINALTLLDVADAAGTTLKVIKRMIRVWPRLGATRAWKVAREGRLGLDHLELLARLDPRLDALAVARAITARELSASAAQQLVRDAATLIRRDPPSGR